MLEKRGSIPNILKTHFLPWLGEDEDLAWIVESLAVLLVGTEDLLRPEVSETVAAPKSLVPIRLITHESIEVLYPRIMLVPIEEINALLESLF